MPKDRAARVCARARLSCLLELLYATGLRVSELVALPRSAAAAKEALIVKGKGGKERLVPLNTAAKQAMATYLALADEIREGAHAGSLGKKPRRAAASGPEASPHRSGKRSTPRPAKPGNYLFRADSASRPSSAPGFRPRIEGARGKPRNRVAARQPPCAAPRLREPSLAKRRGFTRRARAPWSLRHRDHTNLHTSSRRARQIDGARPAPFGRRRREKR